MNNTNGDGSGVMLSSVGGDGFSSRRSSFDNIGDGWPDSGCSDGDGNGSGASAVFDEDGRPSGDGRG